VVRGDGLSREIDEEMQAHLEEAVQRGRDAVEARKAFGSPLQYREASRDVRLLVWLDSLRADAVFGCRQLLKRKMTSAAAVVSLALAIGSCASAFRLIDALLLRPLPVKAPEQLFELVRAGMGFDGKPQTFDGWAYPSFQQMSAAVRDQAELLAISYAERVDMTYRSDQDMEKACVQYVSGSMFGSFGLRPAAGRLLTERDDRIPGAHPYAVISYDYWVRRFGKDASVVGRTFRLGAAELYTGAGASSADYEIVGVVDAPFSGTETGTVTDIFLPTMMHPGAVHDDWTWHRTLARLRAGVPKEPVRAKLSAVSRAFEMERAKGFKGMKKEAIDRFINQALLLEPAATGASRLQQDYARGLWALGALVGLVLLIACANVANLISAQSAARGREMALRVSIGAGRLRLVQQVLVESAVLALLAAGAGGVFAWWSAPFVVSRINPPDNPARLALPADWRVLGFGLAVTLLVTFLFGLMPALRTSVVKPAAILKGGEDPHSRRRTMHALIAVQVAFCFLVLFMAGLFAITSERLSHRPMGFSAERLLAVDAVTRRPVAPVYWEQVAEHLRTVPGVEMVAISGWPLLSGNAWNGFISVRGAPPSAALGYFLAVSPGWMDAMKMAFVSGGDFRPSDASPGAAIVNEAFVKQFLNSEGTTSTAFARGELNYRVVGVVRDAPYRNVRENILPVAYLPFHQLDGKGALRPTASGTFIVKTSSRNPYALASTLRREVPGARPEFRVNNIRTQEDLVRAQTVRERLLAMLSIFFAVVALVLAAVGLYGVLDYSVVQRRRELGIRIAIGAAAGEIARRVTGDAAAMVAAGGLAGMAFGLVSARYVSALFYEVQANDAAMLAAPALVILLAAVAAAVPAVIRAVRINPVTALRSE